MYMKNGYEKSYKEIYKSGFIERFENATFKF